jgi:hypothetical protein
MVMRNSKNKIAIILPVVNEITLNTLFIHIFSLPGTNYTGPGKISEKLKLLKIHQQQF